jgi:hypothetical protein
MKYSEYLEADRNGLTAYIDKRWSQLAQAHEQAIADNSKYIFLVNSGAAVATLTFIGTVEKVREQSWPTGMLMMFVIGVILVGVAKLVQIHELNALFEGWRKDTSDFYTDARCWDDVLKSDSARSSRNSIAAWVNGVAFVLFVFGVIVGAVNFNSIAKGDPNDRKEQAATSKTITTPISPAGATTEGRGRGEARRGKDPAPVVSASPTPGPKEIIQPSKGP